VLRKKLKIRTEMKNKTHEKIVVEKKNFYKKSKNEIRN
jgi:hypothetical protein